MAQVTYSTQSFAHYGRQSCRPGGRREGDAHSPAGTRRAAGAWLRCPARGSSSGRDFRNGT
jgi:hypothetical protein